MPTAETNEIITNVGGFGGAVLVAGMTIYSIVKRVMSDTRTAKKEVDAGNLRTDLLKERIDREKKISELSAKNENLINEKSQLCTQVKLTQAAICNERHRQGSAYTGWCPACRSGECKKGGV